jgi:hypothetical protein
VTLINSNGMALFGPGSEWFWAMLQFAALAITFVAIYRQLRGQRSASVFEQMAAWEREWKEIRFMRERLLLVLDLEGRDVTDGLPLPGFEVGDFFERLGYLVSQGHLRRQDVWHDWRPAIGKWWGFMGPYIERQRVIDDFPATFEWFEHLEREMQRLDLRLGSKPFVDTTTVAEMIDGLTAALEQEQDAAQGIIPTRKVAPTPEPTQA